MKRFRATYWVKHTKEFWVQNEEAITAILNEDNECKVEEITELPADDKDFAGA